VPRQTTTLSLTDLDRALLAGAEGDGARMAMRIVVKMAELQGATRLVDVTRAHVDGCLYHGTAGLDFVERLAEGGAAVRVPTTLNVGSLDLLHPQLFRGDPDTARQARRLMDRYVDIGCEPTWTCAPYQLPARPAFGEQIAWAESNAIVFANSVLGARTNRYGDFMDICAAVTGRVPLTGYHTGEGRRGELVFDLTGLPAQLRVRDAFFPVLGHLVGARAGGLVPVLVGVPLDATEDQLRSLGAAAASAGAVALFHAVGVTPEAPTLRAALGGVSAPVVRVTPAMIGEARRALSSGGDGEIVAVSLGTPHFSLGEFERLLALLADLTRPLAVDVYVSTSRFVLAELRSRDWLDVLEGHGITIVVDTCTYVTPILRHASGRVMTNSAKWAYYAPGNLGLDAVFGSLKECLQSAIRGRVWRDEALWAGC
jgi:predicted aconitase